MQVYNEVLFSLLKSGLWNEELILPDGFNDWNSILKIARRQAVLGIVAKTIVGNTGLQDSVPNTLRLKLKSFIVANVMTSNHIIDVIKRVCTLLNDNGVDCVLLKGAGLAQYYPYPELRQCGDIDIFVDQEHLYKTHEVLTTISDSVDDKLYVDCGKHFKAVVENIEVEVHKHLSSHVIKPYSAVFAELSSKGLTSDLDTVNINSFDIHTPECTFNAFYIFDHIFEHFLTSGVGLRQMCDWMMFLHNNYGKINTDALYEMLQKMDMLQPWKIFGNVLVRYMGLSQDRFPFYEEDSRSEIVLRYIIEDGNFGKDSAYYCSTSRFLIIKKFKSLMWHLKRGFKMIRLFPKHEIRHFIYIFTNALDYIRVHFMIKFTSWFRR